MNVWFTTASRDRDQAAECLAAWRSLGYKTAALFVLGMETIREADIIFYVSDFQSVYDALNISSGLLVQQHDADVVVTGHTDTRPDPSVDPAQVAANGFARITDGCFIIQPASGPLWLGRGWIDQAYRGHGPFWAEYRTSWADTEAALVAARLGRLIVESTVEQRGVHVSAAGDESLFNLRQSQSFPESALWVP